MTPTEEIDDMALPDSMTCGDCVHLPRCVAVFGSHPENTKCDFSPSKFLSKEYVRAMEKRAWGSLA